MMSSHQLTRIFQVLSQNYGMPIMNEFSLNGVLTRYDSLNIMPYVLSLLVFILPMSSTGLGIALGLMFATWLSAYSDYSTTLFKVLATPWMLALGAFLLWICLSCFWSSAPLADQLAAIKKYAKLLSFPVLVVAFTNPTAREWSLRAFLAAMLLCVVLVLVQWFFHLHVGRYLSIGSLFRNYIMMGHMMALGCYLTAWRALTIVSKRWVYVVLFVLFSIEILFLSESRTGQLLYFGLLLLLMIQQFNRRQCVLGVLLLLLFAGVAFYANQSFRTGFETLVQNVNQYRAGMKYTPVGQRLQFHAFAEKLFLDKPWSGQGAGSFAYFAEVENPVPEWDQGKLLEPHNLYWLIASEFGVIGFIFLSLFFVFLFYASASLPTMKPLAFAVLIPFLIGNLSDSLLYYSGSGYFFLVMIALCLGEWVWQNKKVL